MSPKIRVAVVYGGRSAEHEVSVVSARCVLDAIDRDKYEVIPVAITKQGRWMLPSVPPAQLTAPGGGLPDVGDEGTAVTLSQGGLAPALSPGTNPGTNPGTSPGDLRGIDVVFPVLHGPYGEDGTIQGLLELAGVPYVGAGVLGSALGMDKEMQRRLFQARGIPVVPWLHLHQSNWRRNPEGCLDVVADQIGFPCFTKPARLGSSIGISKCASGAELREGLATAFTHDDKAIVERAVIARELECAVLGNDEPEASVVGEVVTERDFYDYQAKYLEESSRTIVPAQVPGAVAERVRRLAIEVFAAIECAGMARVDFFYEEESDGVFVNEINTIPGFTPISMYPKLWEASGVPYAKLIDRLIELALDRFAP